MKHTAQINLIRLAAYYLRHTPLEFGRWRFTNTMLPQMRKHGANMGEIDITTRWGFRFHCRMDDWLSQYVYLTGTYERSTSDVIGRLMRPGDVAIDVGANVGYFTLLLARLAGEEGHVYAFEPIPGVARDLHHNIALNGFGNISVEQVAVCNENAEQTLYEGPPDHRGISSMRNLDNASQVLKVQGIRLDDHLIGVSSLRLMKIDVEGAEQTALEGMSDLVGKHRPYVVIEFTDAFLRNFGHSAQSLAEWFQERGYRLYHITSDGLRALDVIGSGLPKQYNVLCVPQKELPEELVSLQL